MEKIKEESGITLIVLMVIIVIMLILTGVSVQTGTESLEGTRLKGFYTQLEVIQKRVDDIAGTNESYVDSEGNTVYIKEQGFYLTDDQKTSLQTILDTEGIAAEVTNFKYFTIEDLEKTLDLLEMEYNVFIDFENRIVVAENGIEIEDKTYHVLKNKTYFVEQNTNKNIGTIESLIYSEPTQYGTNKYKVTMTPSNTVGDVVGTGYVKYKKTTTKYWETSNNTEIILEFGVEYNIQYIDPNNNSIEKIIKVEFVQDENNNNILTVTEITEENESEVN